MNRRESERILKFFAIFVIYLTISLTFLTAKAFATLNHDISGENGISGYARSDKDFITIYVNASGEVSFESDALGDIPLTGCEEVGDGVRCEQTFEPTTIDPSVASIPFRLVQSSGTPPYQNGVLNIDSQPPGKIQLDVKPEGTGLNFTYTFKDYQTSTSETTCKGSGIGYIEIRFQGRAVYTQSITTSNCTVSGSYYLNLANTYVDKASYSVIVRDRVGNEYNSGSVIVSGDFKAPTIAETFIITRSGEEITGLSSGGEVTADLVIEVEDTELSAVYGNLSSININPAVSLNPGYQNAAADCVKDSGNLYICTFKNMRFRPSGEEIAVTIIAVDAAGNKAIRQISKVYDIKDSAGGVLYLGPAKDHCTSDLKDCYVRPGRQLIYAELDTTSSYSKSILNIGVNSERTFSICRLNSTWKCTGVYNIDSTSEMFIAESYDDYGNMLESDVERTLYLDEEKPKNLTSLYVFNSNNNNNCSVSGDELEFRINISESTPELKMYVNTSGFTSKQEQKGTCERLESGNYECVLTVEGFSSVASNNLRDIVIEDLAGNLLNIPYKFEVCKSTSDKVPNVIFDVMQGGTPKIDRRTANKISVKTYVPLSLRVQPGATLMYLNIERCIALGQDGLNVMGTGHSLVPNFGNNPTLALYVGHSGAILPENSLTVNCTMTARVRVGPTVYLQEEKQEFTINVNTYVNELGTIDKSTNEEVNDVKANLRSLDKKIASWEKSIGWLGKVCSIAESLGKINSVLQAVKSAVYGVLIAINLIFPEFDTPLQGIWSAVYGTLGSIHGFVTEFIWPPGIIPGKGSGISVGTVVKWVCLLYTCKHYDAGTIIQVTQELVGRFAQSAEKQPTSKGYGQATGDDKIEYTDAEGKPQQGVYRDSSGNIVTADGKFLKETEINGVKKLVVTNSNGIPVDDRGREVTYKNGKAELVTSNDKPVDKPAGTMYGTPSEFMAGASTTTTSMVVGKEYVIPDWDAPDEAMHSPSEYSDWLDQNMQVKDVYQKVSISSTGPSSTNQVKQNAQAISAQNEMLINALNGHSWVIDPYKSIHYDGLCIPAYIYNLKKERQIDCMYLSCLEQQKGVASPKIMCDGNYKVNKCLYLDSAEYVIGGSHVWKSFAKGLWDSFENTALSIAIGIGYRRLCRQDYHMEEVFQHMSLKRDGWKTSLCGIIGGVFGARELIDTFKNPYATVPILADARGSGEVDYCEGLDYQNEYTDMGDERWFDG